jgi:hypothetical protein
MNIDTLLTYGFDLYTDYQILVVVVTLVLLWIAYKNPQKSFKFVLFLVVLAAFFYAISLFRGTVMTGTQNAQELIRNSKDGGQ